MVATMNVNPKVVVDYRILEAFQISGEPLSFEPLKRGHINDTYVSRWSSGKRYIHQQINSKVFKDVPGLMRNVQRVLAHWRAKAAADRSTTGLRPLELVPTVTGGALYEGGDLGYWRTYQFVEGTRGIDFCRAPSEAREAARAFSKFQEYLLDCSTQGLIEVIPGFHDTPKRLQQLRDAATRDPVGRLRAASRLVEVALQHSERAAAITDGVTSGAIPLRVTHNDLKVNNVLFDDEGRQAVTVVDLDTCMPGSLLYDFGDLMRCTAVACAEDERDLSKVVVDLGMAEAVLDGYLEHLTPTDGTVGIVPSELALMASAPAVLAIELGSRFLADFLLGDPYFKVDREDHNLTRAITQFAIAEQLIKAEPQFRKFIEARRGAP
jgi:hypothetical protein